MDANEEEKVAEASLVLSEDVRNAFASLCAGTLAPSMIPSSLICNLDAVSISLEKKSFPRIAFDAEQEQIAHSAESHSGVAGGLQPYDLPPWHFVFHVRADGSTSSSQPKEDPTQP